MPSTLSVNLNVNMYKNRQDEMYAVALITYVLVVFAVALRFWARRLLKTQIWLDDWIAAAALVNLQESEDLEMTSS